MELISACEITGKKAVSCLIDGIRDPTIQGARAGRYGTPNDLYAEYFSTLNPEAGRSSAMTERFQFRGLKRTHNESNFKQSDKQHKRNDKSEQRCYNCKGKKVISRTNAQSLD